MALDRKLQPRHARHLRGVACNRDAHLAGIDAALACLHAGDAAVVDHHAGHFAVLDDVHAELRSGAGIAPGHRIVTHGAGAGLMDAAPDREARILRVVEIGQQLLDLAAVEQFGVDAVEAHDVAAPREHVELHRAHGEHDLAAVRDHAVVVQFVREALPQLHRMLEELGVAVDHIVGADERGVAADIARADVGPFQHGDVGDAVVLGEVVGGGKAVAAAADDHHVIGGARRGLFPGHGPGGIRLQRMPEE